MRGALRPLTSVTAFCCWASGYCGVAMRLVVETGQGLPEANSYIVESDAQAFLPSALADDWLAFLPDERIDHLIAATQFIDVSFRWAGKIKSLEQGLLWPRTGITFQGHEVSPDDVPRQIRRATLMALQILMQEGFDLFQSTGDLLIKRERLAAIETEYFAPPDGDGDYKSAFTDINNLLKGFYITQTKGGVIVAEVLRR